MWKYEGTKNAVSYNQGSETNMREEVSAEHFDTVLHLIQENRRSVFCVIFDNFLNDRLTLAKVQPSSFSLYSTEMLFLKMSSY